MKLLKLVSITVCLVCAVMVGAADAKWWIFGASEDEVTTSYLFLNRVAFNELGSKVTLYKDMLPDGMVMIQGKGNAGQNKVGSVRITMDNKETWVDAKLSESGAFEYGFKPEMGKTYKLFVEVTDTRGKTNKIEDTYKELTISDQNIMALVRDIMDKLIDAYQREDSRQFMGFVADDFAADKTLLDRAIRTDFLYFDNISLRYTINGIASASDGKVFAMISYSRMLTSTKSGQPLSDRGMTQFTFKLGDKGLRLWDMKYPLIFGLTDSSNVATGVTNTSSSENVIVCSNKGECNLLPFAQAVQAEQAGGTTEATTIELTCTFNQAGPQCQGFTFATGQVGPGGTGQDIILAEFGGLFFKPGTGHINLGSKSIDSVSSVPTTGYAQAQAIFDLQSNIGHCFALQLATAKYAVIYIQNFIQAGAGGTTLLRMRYKYQPNGTAFFGR